MIHDSIYAPVDCQIADNQHGFIKGKSTATNLACITQYMYVALDKSAHVDVFYKDFSKAFNTVDHGILLEKLLNFVLTLDFVNLMSYLNDRTLQIQCLDFRSEEFETSSGVHQGSVLGPLSILKD